MTNNFKFQISNFKFKFCRGSLAIGHSSPQSGVGLPRRNALATQKRSIWEQVSFVRGQSLFEVLFAVAVAAVILVGVVSLSTTSIRNASYSNNNALATKYAQEAVEWLREERDKEWAAFSNRTSGGETTWCLADISWPGTAGNCGPNIAGTIFEREATLRLITTTDPGDTVEVLMVVSWDDAQGAHSVRSVTKLTNWNR